MTDFHRNIYSYFRGGSQSDQDRERQLEDNTTKALVNTLEHCDRRVVVEFLEWLGISASGLISFEQQKATIGGGRISRKSQRLLLAIVGKTHKVNESICNQLPMRVKWESRPDAWIVGDDFVVLVESKVGNALLGKNQMACHWQKLKPCQLKIVTWAEIHRYFVAKSSSENDTRIKWMIEQFTQYLEWTGMTEFVGFREEMFEFFVASDRDPDMKRWVRGAVESLGDKVLSGGLKNLDTFYSDKHVGNLTSESDHYWVAFGPAKDFSKKAHQTISLYEQKLDVFVNVELLPSIKLLRKKIKEGGFRKVMCDLPAPFTVRIEQRQKTKRPRFFDYKLVADIITDTHKRKRYGLTDTDSPGFEYIEKLLTDIDLPYLSVRRSLKRSEVLALSKPNGDALVTKVVEILKAFHPLVQFINE